MNLYLTSVYRTRQILAYIPVKLIVYDNMISGLHKVNRMRKSELCCTGRLLKTIFEMRTLYHFQKMSQWSRSTSAGMCLIEMHQHYPWGPILNGLMPLTRMTKHKNLQGFTKHKKKKAFTMDYLVTNGKTLPLCGKEKIVQLKKMKEK